MAEKATIARPYAKAAFEFAQQKQAFEPWSSMLASGSAVAADERIAKLLTHPRVAPNDLVDLIAEASGGSLDEYRRNFLLTLAHNHRLGLLPEIAAQFEVLRAEVENVADVKIISAVELNQAQQDRLVGALKKRLKREVRLHCEVDASLVGGAIVRSGDFVIDGSLRARLERLAGAMTH